MTRPVDSLRAFVAGGGRDPSHRHAPGVVVFGAGKGGVGTSLVAGLVAVAAARRGASVLLVDADETVGSLQWMFGLEGERPGLGELRGGRVSPEELLVRVAPGLSLFPGGGGGVDATLAVAAAERRMLMRRVSALYASYDLTLVDGGSRLDSVMASCAAGAERLVCVTTPDRIAQAAAYALLKVTHGRFHELRVELCVNRATEPVAREVHGLMEAATGTFLDLATPFGGALPQDVELGEHLDAGGTLLDGPDDGPAMVAAGGLADRVLHEHEAQHGQPPRVIPIRHTRPRQLG